MMERFWVKNPLYPVVSIAVMLTTFVGALLMARSVCGAVFLAAVYLLFAVFGYGKNCLRLLPFLAGYLLLFSAVFYVCSGGNLTFTGQMVIRLAGVVIAAIPGLSLPPVALVRSLTALHCPRLLTLGMLISMSFGPGIVCGDKTGAQCDENKRRDIGFQSDSVLPGIFYSADRAVSQYFRHAGALGGDAGICGGRRPLHGVSSGQISGA